MRADSGIPIPHNREMELSALEILERRFSCAKFGGRRIGIVRERYRKAVYPLLIDGMGAHNFHHCGGICVDLPARDPPVAADMGRTL